MTRRTTICSCGTPTAGSRLCERCEKTVAYAIAHVGVYYVDFNTAVAAKQTRYTSDGATKGSIGKTQPMPVDSRFVVSHNAPTRSPATQLRWDAWNTVTEWTKTVAAQVPDSADFIGPVCPTCGHSTCSDVRGRRRPTTGTVAAMIRYLARQFRHIIRQDYAPQMMDEFLNLESRLRRMVDRPADRWYAGLCSTPLMNADTSTEALCQVELYARTDRGWIDCPGCGTRHDVAGRRDFLLNEAGDILVTATEAARALLAWTDQATAENKLVDRIRKWAERHRLEVRGAEEINGRERQLYRLGDIQQLMVEHAQRNQARHIGAAS